MSKFSKLKIESQIRYSTLCVQLFLETAQLVGNAELYREIKFRETFSEYI